MAPHHMLFVPISGPVLLHCVTVKGKGYEPAENSADKYHGGAKFDARGHLCLFGNTLVAACYVLLQKPLFAEGHSALFATASAYADATRTRRERPRRSLRCADTARRTRPSMRNRG